MRGELRERPTSGAEPRLCNTKERSYDRESLVCTDKEKGERRRQPSSASMQAKARRTGMAASQRTANPSPDEHDEREVD